MFLLQWKYLLHVSCLPPDTVRWFFSTFSTRQACSVPCIARPRRQHLGGRWHSRWQPVDPHIGQEKSLLLPLLLLLLWEEHACDAPTHSFTLRPSALPVLFSQPLGASTATRCPLAADKAPNSPRAARIEAAWDTSWKSGPVSKPLAVPWLQG